MPVLCFALGATALNAPEARSTEQAARAAVPSGFALDGSFRQGGIVRGSAPAGTVELSLDGAPVAISGQREFLIAFDRDSPRSALLSARLEDGRTVTERLVVEPGSWRIQHVDVARRPAGPSEEFLRIRRGELERIAQARAANAASEGWRQQFAWPARGRISSPFGSQRIYRDEPGGYHSGVDISPGAGTPVVAPADGVVVLASPPSFSLEGNLVIVDHGMGLNSALLHLADVAVREGQRVRQGQLIGHVGATGRATGPHLHWSMMWRDARIDPQAMLAAVPQRRP